MIKSILEKVCVSLYCMKLIKDGILMWSSMILQKKKGFSLLAGWPRTAQFPIQSFN
jgi:hypothetical protein